MQKNKQSLSLRGNIILTGGHAATTAIATIDEIKNKYPDWNLCWISAKPSTDIQRHGVKTILITTGKLQRKFTIWTIPNLFKVPYGTMQSLKIILKLKPKLIISFGGYASVPVCFAAFIFRIPIIIHEQTAGAGLANIIVSKFATRITIARKESAHFFPTNKTILIGNPVRKEILNVKFIRRNGGPKLPKKPTIYITGGSSGSVSINKVIDSTLEELLTKYKIIHQTGSTDFDYFKKKSSSAYEVYDFIDMSKIPEVFEKADFIVSRAGANTVAEIMITKRPSILIPIPWVQNDEQTKNAKLAEDAGIAIIIKQDEFNSETLIHGLELLQKNWKTMVNSPDSELVKLDRLAAKRFAEEISKLVNEKDI